MAKRETSTQKWYVYTGTGAIRTEDGTRTSIAGDEGTARPFVASVGWLRRHAPVKHRLIPLEDWKAAQQEHEAKADEPAEKEPEAKPEAVEPKVRKAKKANKE